MAHARWLRKSSTPALNTLSPTASMWSRSGISSAFAPGMSAASSCAEPATGSLVPTATRTGKRIAASCSRAQRLPRAADTGGERLEVGFGLLGEAAEHAAGRIGHIRQARALPGRRRCSPASRRPRRDGCRARRRSQRAGAADARRQEMPRCARPSNSPSHRRARSRGGRAARAHLPPWWRCDRRPDRRACSTGRGRDCRAR